MQHTTLPLNLLMTKYVLIDKKCNRSRKPLPRTTYRVSYDNFCRVIRWQIVMRLTIMRRREKN